MKLENLRIGTRLGGGFGILMVLFAVVVSVALWQFNSLSRATRDMMHAPLERERLISEWSRLVEVAVRRTTAVVMTNDPSLEALFAADAKIGTARGDAIGKLLESYSSSPDEAKALADVSNARNNYLVARRKIPPLQHDGHADEASKVFKTEFLPLSQIYLQKMQALLEVQRAAIDGTSQNIEHEADRLRGTLLALGGVALMLGIAFAIALTRSITRPIATATRLTEAVALGNLTSRITSASGDELGTLMRSLAKMTDDLRRIVSSVRASTDSIGTASAEIAMGNQDLSNRTEQTASNLQQTAAAIEQLTGKVEQSASSARDARQLALDAAEVASRGGALVADVVATMVGINTSSKKIADIIGVIDGIAFQTNILALNAAVEAARAGEQGRGFAVVASEVRGLAHRSAAAAKEIKLLIGASVGEVETGSKLVAEAGKTMQDIVLSVQRVSDTIGEITVAANDQSEGIGQINGAVNQLDQMTQQNAALVEESAAAAESLRAQAAALLEVVGVFNLETRVLSQ